MVPVVSAGGELSCFPSDQQWAGYGSWPPQLAKAGDLTKAEAAGQQL